MASLNAKDIVVKQENDIKMDPIEIEVFISAPIYNVEVKQELEDEGVKYPTSSVFLKRESVELTYQVSDSSVYNQVVLKQEPSDVSKSTVCNDVLNNINIESVKEHFKGECDYCKEQFDHRQSLVKHIDKHIRQQTCRTCNVLFSTHLDYIHHCKISHSVNVKRPYICDVCDKRFTKSSILKSHLRIHTNERPYVCQLCNKSFTQSTSLKRHRPTHTNERPYTCNVCYKGFTQRGHLKSHQMTHTNERPYACDVCNKSFTQRGHLKYHRLTHTKERPFFCNACPKRFTTNCALKRHLVTHTNESPYT